MNDEDIRNLLGGFATDTLTGSERELLFGWQAWLDVQVLRREAEALIAPAKR